MHVPCQGLHKGESMLLQSGIVENLIARLDGPLHFRFIMQPTVASILAIIGGVKDAKAGKPAYFWAVLVSPGHRKELIKDGWKSIWKVCILAMVLEVAYQLISKRPVVAVWTTA